MRNFDVKPSLPSLIYVAPSCFYVKQLKHALRVNGAYMVLR